MLFVMMASAIMCMVLSIFMGALAVLFYLPSIASIMNRNGLSLLQLRPLHTTFASAWLFLGAATYAYKFLFDTFGEPTPADRMRFKIHMGCWGLAGLGALVTLPLGITSGREYLGLHPGFSVLILFGWILFAYTFFKKVWRGFWERPVYVYMWGAGILYFIYTFIEGHAYLLPWIKQYPVVDLQIQWKSCGTLVAAFNQMVYASLFYLGERLSGDKRIAQSQTAFWLFGIGLLNSFTNFAHHTYHLPQSHLVKWIAFGVSMLEIILLVRVYIDVTKSIKQKTSPLSFNVSVRLIELSKNWNLFLLFMALLISIPPLNAIIHGTHVVMAHAMGSELAIDTYILLAVMASLLSELFPKREILQEKINSPTLRNTIFYLNLSLAGVVVLLLINGITVGITRYLGLPQPEMLAYFPKALAVFGLSLGFFMLRLLLAWWPFFKNPNNPKLHLDL